MTMVAVFLCLDAIIFYLFWELSLVPMLLIIRHGVVIYEFMLRLNSFYTPLQVRGDVNWNVVFRICLFSNDRELEL